MRNVLIIAALTISFICYAHLWLGAGAAWSCAATVLVLTSPTCEEES